MAEERVQRRLAAILAADVVGYSRLVGMDEEGTLSAFKDHLNHIVEPSIARNRGRIVKTMGDGVLAEFASAVDAVLCARAIQEGMIERNADVAEDRRLRFRIGVNVGDIVIDGDDIQGDGVNIAARLEGIAEPDGICISGTAYDQVHGKLDAAFVDLGEQQVKNIARPIRAYRVTDTGDAANLASRKTASWKRPAIAAGIAALVAVAGSLTWWQPWQPDVEPASLDKMAFKLPDRPSIAVLPFTNMSGDKEQEYFSDGITEDIITDLSKVSGLFVIARNSSFKFKGRSVDVRDVARDLGVGHIVEGSVRKSGSRVRITAQLIDARTGSHLWAERYDRELSDIFGVQDDVVGRIVAALAVKLTDADKARRVRRRVTVNLQAYEYVLRGRQLLTRIAGQDTERARKYFEKAISIDPGYARAYTNLGLLYWNAWRLWGRDRAGNLTRALQIGKKAVAHDPDDAGAHTLLAVIHQFRKEHDLAEIEANKAIALEPTQAETLGNLGGYLWFAGRPREAIEYLERAVRLDPYHPSVYLTWLGGVYSWSGRYDRAITVLKRAIRREPDYIVNHVALAAAYAHSGKDEDARAQAAEILRLNPTFTLRAFKAFVPIRKKADLDRYVTGLRQAGLPK